MEKQIYYVSIASGEISQIQFGNNDDFTIEATKAEVRDLRTQMDQMNSADIRSFWRAHVPIMSYHHDQPNDDYDAGITKAFQMIYDLGDEQTKYNLKSMGVLGEEQI